MPTIESRTSSTTADVQTGTLFGDSGLSTMLSQFRTNLSNPVSGFSGTFKALSDIGVSTGAASAALNQDAIDGKLTLDETKLRSALDTDPQAVQKLLGGANGTSGFAQGFSKLLSSYQGSAGLIQSRITSATSELSDLATKLTTFDARMDAKQALLTKQFTAMEQALAQSNKAGSSITSLLQSSSSD